MEDFDTMKRTILFRLAAPLALVLLVGMFAACVPATVTPVPVQPTEQAPAPVQSEIITLYVGPELVDCTGVAPQKCMQVKDSPDGAWQNFFDPIAGFTFEPGYNYELKVERTVVENPPADASRFKYALVEVVSKTAAEQTAKPTSAPETTPSKTAALTLEGPTWQLVSLADEKGETIAAMTGVTVTAGFNEGQLTGNGGCNSYFGGYTVDGDKLTITPAGTTMMACDEKVMAQEKAFMAALASAATFQIADGQLQIMNDKGAVVLTFTAQAQPALTGVVWNATFYNNGRGAVVGVMRPETSITAIFGEDGTLSGSAGCNNYSTTYTVDDRNNMIISGAIVTTQKACEQAIMDQEAAYLAALPTTASYNFVDGQLHLRTTEGANVALYEAGAAAGGEPTPEATTAPAAGLEGTNWQMVSYVNDQGETVAALPEAPATALFADGLVSGTTGCNRYGGTYTVDGTALKVTLGPSTMMACPDAQMVQEQGFQAAMANVASYEVAGEQLLLKNAAGDVALTFAPEAQSSLAGTNWQVQAYNNGKQAVVSVLSQSQITAVFGEDGSLSGFGGCNQYATTYKVDGDKITVDPAIATTRKACAPDVMDQERAYLEALVTAATYKLGAGAMELRTESGALAVNYIQSEVVHEEVKPGAAPEATPAAPEATPEPTVAAPETAPAAGLEGVNWQLVSYVNAKGKTVAALPDAPATALFADGSVTGTTGCNRYGGAYTAKGNKLTVKVGFTTMMACPDAQMAQERQYLAALASAASYKVAGDQLVIKNAKGATVLTFKPEAQPALTGAAWQVMSYNNGKQAVVSVLAGTEITALFGEDGSLSGTGGCNQYNTTYKIDGANIAIDPAIATTRMACPPEVMAQESAYLEALKSAATYKTAGNSLELRTADGALAVSFTLPAPGAETAAGGAAPEPTPTVEQGAVNAPAPALTGVVWQWQGTDMSDGSKIKVKYPDHYTVEFLADGKLRLRVDCNTGGGSYKVDGASLAIDAATKTKKQCPSGSKGNLFLQQLNHAGTHVFDGDNLVINLFADSGNMIFSKGGASKP